MLGVSLETIWSANQEANSSESSDKIDISVSYDETWHKRGHTSLVPLWDWHHYCCCEKSYNWLWNTIKRMSLICNDWDVFGLK